MDSHSNTVFNLRFLSGGDSMKKEYSLPFTCVCDNKQVKIPFKKPSPYTGSSFSYKCPNCESEFIIRVIKEHRLGQFKVFVRNEFLSPKFNAVIAMRNND